MEELVSYICRVPSPEKSAFWKDERIQKWVLTIFINIACLHLLIVARRTRPGVWSSCCCSL